ncbi:MAG: hypothetical protein LIP04_12145 [Tannerellaceae bacterium]|nr:hypothetical protein [Tannerellaceae bacterium]
MSGHPGAVLQIVDRKSSYLDLPDWNRRSALAKSGRSGTNKRWVTENGFLSSVTRQSPSQSPVFKHLMDCILNKYTQTGDG